MTLLKKGFTVSLDSLCCVLSKFDGVTEANNKFTELSSRSLVTLLMLANELALEETALEDPALEDLTEGASDLDAIDKVLESVVYLSSSFLGYFPTESRFCYSSSTSSCF